MQIVDLFCGIGSVAEAARADESMAVTTAIDIDRQSNRVYQRIHGIRPETQTLESIDRIPSCDLLWLSPPCQPYTRRGQRRRESDPRSRALQHLIPLIPSQQPSFVVLENVPEFQGSLHHCWLESLLERNGYGVKGQTLCPTQWNIPMRRRRFFLIASRHGKRIADLQIEATPRRLPDYLDDEAWDRSDLSVEADLLSQYAGAIDVVSADDPTAVTACFTSAYGQSPVRAGSYLRCPRRRRVRRFSAQEIARLMGFRDRFDWPSDVTLRGRYRMIGNAVSVTVARSILRSCDTG